VKGDVAYFNRISSGKPPQFVRKIGGGGHACAANEGRNNADVTVQRRFNLQAHVVVGVVESSSTLFVLNREPRLTDDRNQGIAPTHLSADHLDEVVSRIYAVKIHEDTLYTELGGEPIVDSARVRDAVFAPVAYEDTRHGVASAS